MTDTGAGPNRPSVAQAVLAVVAFALAGMGTPVYAQTGGRAQIKGGDVMQGWRVFHDKQCSDCHAILGHGGRFGPDLGRIRVGRLSDAQLAGVMWNHIPKMLGQMKQTGHDFATLSRKEMADVFALIFFVQQLGELGDPARGGQILRDKGCSQCHSTDTNGGTIGPDLAKWGRNANPVVWAQMMWEHAPMMEEAMKRSEMNWPKLEGADLAHIVAYVRTVGVSGERTYLRPGDVDRGKHLFIEKQCDSCHPGNGPDLATADLPASVGALAARMWNHSPGMIRAMREHEVEKKPVAPQELADILAYVLALGNVDNGGDPVRGQRVLERKGCLQCHDREDMAEAGAPSLLQLESNATPVNMAAAMWNHGETMLEQMTVAGLSWPVFSGNEMVDLLACLRAGPNGGRESQSTGAKP